MTDTSSPTVEVEPGLQTGFLFRVMACSDVQITLISSPHYKYYIMVGTENNTVSYIRRREAIVKTVVRTTGLRCTEYQAMWVSWREGTLRVGRGSMIGDATFLEYADEFDFTDTIRTVVLEQASLGDWLLPRNIGTSFTLTTPPFESFTNYWFSTIGEKYFIFSVMSCQDVMLALSQTYGVATDRTYKVSATILYPKMIYTFILCYYPITLPRVGSGE